MLDTALLGRISLKQVCPESAEVLTSFKDWTESLFGSVLLAFSAFDTDGGGTLTYSELRNACNKYKWQGQVRLLFDSLDVEKQHAPGKRSISVKEIAFLDTWELDPDGIADVPPKLAELPPPLTARRYETDSWQEESIRSTMWRSSSDPSLRRSARCMPKSRAAQGAYRDHCPGHAMAGGLLPDVSRSACARMSETFTGAVECSQKTNYLSEASFCKSYGVSRDARRPHRGKSESLPPLAATCRGFSGCAC